MYNARYISLTFIGLAVCVAITLRAAAVDVLLMFGQADSLVGGVLSLSECIALGSGVATFFILLKTTSIVTFTDTVISELTKVTWPDREETTNSSLVVIAASIIFAGSLALFDFVWAQVTDTFLFSAS